MECTAIHSKSIWSNFKEKSSKNIDYFSVWVYITKDVKRNGFYLHVITTMINYRSTERSKTGFLPNSFYEMEYARSTKVLNALISVTANVKNKFIHYRNLRTNFWVTWNDFWTRRRFDTYFFEPYMYCIMLKICLRVVSGLKPDDQKPDARSPTQKARQQKAPGTKCPRYNKPDGIIPDAKKPPATLTRCTKSPIKNI